MKHAREDYNHIQDPSGKIPADEPVFLLRGQDKIAPQLLVEWANLLEAMGGDQDMANKVRNHAMEMLKWQRDKRMKIPDEPKLQPGPDGHEYDWDLLRRQMAHLETIMIPHKIHGTHCLHDKCTECHGTGVRSNGGPCIHHISCPCPKCSHS